MNIKQHRELVNRIRRTFLRLLRVCGSNQDFSKYLDFLKTEERGHRRFCPDGLQCGLTLSDGVRLFAAKELFERFVPQPGAGNIFTPTAKDFFHVRHSVFAACAIAEECADAILAEFTRPEMADFCAACDYAELNKDPRTLKAA